MAHIPIKRTRTPYVILAILLVGTPARLCWGSAAHADEILQQALVKESGERDPEAAIQLYQQVIDEPGAGSLVSEARLRMAGCYERLGKTQEAEQLYTQILSGASAEKSEIAHQAQVNLRRIQTLKAQQEAAGKKAMILVKEFKDTGVSAQIGTAFMTPGSLGTVSLGLRYRVASSLLVEGGFVAPLGGEKAQGSVTAQNDPSTRASIVFRHQLSLGLVGELPHGTQRAWVPQIGAGFARTSSKVEMVSGDHTQSVWSPYVSGGVHLYPDNLVSVVLQGRYVADPYPGSVVVPALGRNASFDFPSSLWTLGAQLQIKIKWPKVTMRPKA